MVQLPGASLACAAQRWAPNRWQASKAAINQVIISLNKELAQRSASPTIALALHPGTVAGTDLSSDFAPKEQQNTKDGIFSPDVAAEKLVRARCSSAIVHRA
jgi:NAD(P)-dependent dehydrogenase (short-subunit alcohol dehydrogenase family)